MSPDARGVPRRADASRRESDADDSGPGHGAAGGPGRGRDGSGPGDADGAGRTPRADPPAPGGDPIRLHQRLRSQRLDQEARTTTADAAQVVRAVSAVQAQDMRAALLGIRARSTGLRATDVMSTLRNRRSVVRAWCMRGTLHLIAAEHLADLLAVFGPVYIARGRRRLAQLGLDDQATARALPRMATLLSDGHARTRREIADAVRSSTVPVDPDGQAPVHLVRRACLEGIAVEAGERDGAPTYVRLDAWVVPRAPADRVAALARLAERYVAAHAPVEREDFAAWSGLPAADVRRAWDTRATSGRPPPRGRGATAPGRPAMSDPASDRPTAAADHDGEVAVRLLPAFDAWILGYRDRGHAVPSAHWTTVHPGGGIMRPIAIVDGVAVATWRLDARRRPARVIVTPFAALPARARAGLDAEIADIGRFLGVKTVAAAR